MIFFENLHRELASLVSESNNAVELFSPYVTRSALEEMLKTKKPKARVAVITTWKLADVAFGASDPSIYEFCKAKGVFLFLNQQLHLKTYIADYKKLLTGSANLTNRALGLSERSNYETLVRIDDPHQHYLVYLAQIRKEATLVTDEIAAQFGELYRKYRAETLDHRNIVEDAQLAFDNELDTRTSFLVSALPMSRSIDELYKVLKGDSTLEEETVANARHDIANFNLEELSSKPFAEFRTTLTTRFFQHPFISSLCDFIDEPKRFGAIKEWVQNNCTDVPVPSRRSLTENVQVLYGWLTDLGEDRFEVTRPNHSEIISPRIRAKN